MLYAVFSIFAESYFKQVMVRTFEYSRVAFRIYNDILKKRR